MDEVDDFYVPGDRGEEGWVGGSKGRNTLMSESLSSSDRS